MADILISKNQDQGWYWEVHGEDKVLMRGLASTRTAAETQAQDYLQMRQPWRYGGKKSPVLTGPS